MKTLALITLTLSLSVSAFAAAPVHCQKEVEKQNPGLASESRANPENKAKIMEQIRNGETRLSKKEEQEVLRVLSSRSAMAFTFGNDAGTWLAIADFSTCKNLLTIQVQEN